MWDEPLVERKGVKFTLIRNHKRCFFIKTVARWPWKSASSKNRV